MDELRLPGRASGAAGASMLDGKKLPVRTQLRVLEEKGRPPCPAVRRGGRP